VGQNAGRVTPAPLKAWILPISDLFQITKPVFANRSTMLLGKALNMIIRILKYGTVTILILALGFLGIATINQHNKLRQAQLDERLASQLNNHDSTETASGFNTLSSTKDKTNASTVKSNGSTAQMLGFKPFVPSVCTTTLLPYRTTYENVSFLATGKTQVFIYGLNGSLRHCTPDSTGFAPIDVTYKPTDQVVWVGTGTSS